MEEITAQLIKANCYLPSIAASLVVIDATLLFFFFYWIIRKE
jgi:hypothetical protein